MHVITQHELQRLTKKIDIKFSVKIRDIHKIEEKYLWALVFFGYKKNIQSMYQKNGVKKNMLIYY